MTEHKFPMVHPQKPYPVSIYADNDPNAEDIGITILRKSGLALKLPTDHEAKKVNHTPIVDIPKNYVVTNLKSVIFTLISSGHISAGFWAAITMK